MRHLRGGSRLRLPRNGRLRRWLLTTVAVVLGIGLAAACGDPGAVGSDPGGDAERPAAAAAVPDGVPAGAQAAVVERIVDGDTIAVRVDQPGGPLPAATSSTVRLLEIDTPETAHPDAGVECGGPEATAFTSAHLPVGSTVYLVADRADTDRYGRFLRYVWTADGAFFNEAIVRAGHARAVLYEPNDAYIDVLRAAEQEARAAGRGIWGPPCDIDAAGGGAAATADEAAPAPAAPQAAPAAPEAAPAAAPAAPRAGCEPGYDPCVPAYPPDLDCADIGHPVVVTGADPHRLDGDGDGRGGEG